MRELLAACKLSALALLALPAAPRPGQAREQFGGFKEFVTGGSLKPFTRDLGGVLGSATFHSGRSLGFPGFDVGAHGGAQFKPGRHNDVMHRAGVGVFGLPWVQAEIGLPFRFDGFIRGVSFQGLTIAGGGLRYGLLKVADTPWKPQVLLSWVGHSVSHRDFSASHLGLNLVVSLGTTAVSPYVGAGADRTRVVVRAVPDLEPALVGAVGTTTDYRLTAGLSLRPFPQHQDFHYLYAQAAATLAHGQPGADVGLGIRF